MLHRRLTGNRKEETETPKHDGTIQKEKMRRVFITIPWNFYLCSCFFLCSFPTERVGQSEVV